LSSPGPCRHRSWSVCRDVCSAPRGSSADLQGAEVEEEFPGRQYAPPELVELQAFIGRMEIVAREPNAEKSDRCSKDSAQCLLRPAAPTPCKQRLLAPHAFDGATKRLDRGMVEWCEKGRHCA